MGGALVTNSGAARLLATGGWPRSVAGAASLSIQPLLQLELRIPDNSALPPAVHSLPTGEAGGAGKSEEGRVQMFCKYHLFKGFFSNSEVTCPERNHY